MIGLVLSGFLSLNTCVRAALLLLLTFSLSLSCRRIKGKETEDEKNEIEEIIETLDNMLAHDDGDDNV